MPPADRSSHRSILPTGRGRRAGFSLIEFLVVLVIMGIMASIAAPSISGYLRRVEAQNALRRIDGDLRYTRMTAIQTGHRARMRFAVDASGCVGTYEIIDQRGSDQPIKTVDLAVERPRTCVRMTRPADPVVFQSRGLPASPTNCTFLVTRGAVADSLVLSGTGRTRRSF
jgi:type II secretion system protein H